MRGSQPLDASEVPELTDSVARLDGAGAVDDDTLEIFRVHCPECRQPIALLADESELPEHAHCATAWDPFGLSVCAGSGRPAAEAGPVQGPADDEDAAAALLTLPAGLDWRTQPFSHVGGAGSRPMQVRRSA